MRMFPYVVLTPTQLSVLDAANNIVTELGIKPAEILQIGPSAQAKFACAISQDVLDTNAHEVAAAIVRSYMQTGINLGIDPKVSEQWLVETLVTQTEAALKLKAAPHMAQLPDRPKA